MYLNKWKIDAVNTSTSDDEKSDFAQNLFKHLVFGVDYVPSDNFWVGIGFNPKTRIDMKLSGGGSGLSGFSAGAGVRIKRFDVGASVAQYHPSALSLMVTLNVTLGEWQ